MLVKARIEFNGFRYEILREHSFNDETRTAISHSLVCPVCCTIWAKHIIESDILLWPKAQFCDKCYVRPDNWHPVPGSLLILESWEAVDESLLEALPHDLFKREFQLLFKAIDNGNFISNSSDHPRLGPLGLTGS